MLSGMTPPAPHNLELYQRAVQNPLATVMLLQKIHRHHGRSMKLPTTPATRLREDFAGSAFLARTWVAWHDNHRALAIDHHKPTFEWAQAKAQRELGERAADLHFLFGDVSWYRPPLVPRVDVIAALNFSVFEYHHRSDLVGYFRGCRRHLCKGGVLVMDAFGPPRPSTEFPRRFRRKVKADMLSGQPGFIYEWEERHYDPLSGKVDCRIHFDLGRKLGKRHDAFVYDWRWWTLPELREAMLEAGFAKVEIWTPQGLLRKNSEQLQQEAFVVYLAAGAG